VQGWLEAVGSATDSILITCQDTTSRWYGIKFDSAPDSSHLKYCIVEYSKNWPYYSNGGIECYFSSPVISHCTLRFNSGFLGGAIYCHGSSPSIEYNEIIHNGREEENYGGGAIYIAASAPVIAYNNIQDNHAGDLGGGAIFCDKGAEPLIIGNYIIGNTVRLSGNWWDGGGVCCQAEIAEVHIIGSIILSNLAAERGGGLCGEWMAIEKSVIYANRAELGGGLMNEFANPATNSIFWGNSPDQIYSQFNSPVTFCDVQDGWPGTGNINSDPLFVAPEYCDFRLQWGSPCIDAGDPDPANNDPDGTRGDMGPFYYDQSLPVRVLLTPHRRSIVIPPDGGSFDFTLWLTNIDPSNPQFTFWIDITLPDGSIFGPVLGPMTAQLDSGVIESRERTQFVPARAAEGVYSFNACAVVGTDTSRDNFSFFKMEPAQDGGISNWTNTGEWLRNLGDSPVASSMLKNFSLSQNYPNPFNEKTVISFQLRTASFVKLAIYDIQGREVAKLVDGWMEAGDQQVTFNGLKLPSGIYLARVTINKKSQTQKIVLMK
jgi:hypothetical protein